MRHYLMTTDEHFAAEVQDEKLTAEGDADKAAQEAAQQAHVSTCSESQPVMTAHKKTPVLPGLANPCDTVQEFRMAGAGFEPTTSRL